MSATKSAGSRRYGVLGPLLARRPVFDRAGAVLGYQLLAAEPQAACAPEAGAVPLPALLSALARVGVERLTGDAPAFVTADADAVAAIPRSGLPGSPVVVVLPLSTVSTERILAAQRHLHGAGVPLALDGRHSLAGCETLLDLADIVLLDAQRSDATLEANVAILKARGLPVIATGVDSDAQYRRCFELGCDGFMGRYLPPAGAPAQTGSTPSLAAALRQLALLQDPDLGREGLASVFRQNLSLLPRLLRFAGRASRGDHGPGRGPVDFVRQLAVHHLRRWSSLILICELAAATSCEFGRIALLRARACELLGSRIDADGDEAFSVGLLSVLDSLLGRPLAEVADGLPLPPGVTAALAGDAAGPAGAALRAVKAYERGAWREAAAAVPTVPVAALRADFLDALTLVTTSGWIEAAAPGVPAPAFGQHPRSRLVRAGRLDAAPAARLFGAADALHADPAGSRSANSRPALAPGGAALVARSTPLDAPDPRWQRWSWPPAALRASRS